MVKAGVEELDVLHILMEDYGFELESETEYHPSAYGDKLFILRKDR